MSFTKCMYKYEVAELLSIKPCTLRRWLNIKYYDELVELGYNKNQKYLTPKQLNYLDRKLEISEIS